MRARNLATFVTLTCLVCIIFLAATVHAGTKVIGLDGQVIGLEVCKSVPNQLNYQGFLVIAADSSAVTATLEMTFRLFDSETEGTELWSETHSAVDVSNGLFQVLLGTVTPFSDDFFDGSDLWLQTEVGTEVLSPRKPLVSVAYSHRTNNAEMLLDNTLTDLDDRWVNEDDLDHLDAADGDPAGAVYVDGAGKVGVGTMSPLTELDVNGSVNATSYYGDGSNLTGISGTPDADWTIAGNHMYSAVPGSVGVGTSTPENKLHVAGDVKATTYYGDGSHLTGISGTTDNDWTINGDDIYHETGNIGIGTASPTAPLTIQTISGTDVEFSSSGNNADMVSSGQFNIGTTGLQNLHLMTGYLTRMCVTGTGQVGIGTISPTQQLDVNGAVNATTYYGDGSNLTGISASPDDDWTINGNDIYHEIGNVCIGTTTPAGKLTVDAGDAIIKGGDGWDGNGDEARLYLGDYNHGVEAIYGQGLRIWTFDDAISDIRFRGHTGTDYMTIKMNSGKVGIGTTSPGSMLDVDGDINADSLYRIGGNAVLSTEGTNNLMVGTGAGENNTESDGTFVGYHAGQNNQGQYCTFVGVDAGPSNEGVFNTFVGFRAGLLNTTHEHNTFVGAWAGEDNEGSDNTFVGYLAGNDNTSGYNNTFLGSAAGWMNETGTQNTFVGTGASLDHTTGDNNTVLGSYAGYYNTSGSDNVFLGYQAGYYETGSGKLYIANGNSNSDILIYGDFSTGNVGLGTLTPERRLHIVGANPRILIEASSSNPEVNLSNSGEPTTSNWSLYKESVSGDLRFYQNGDRLTIQKNTGYVGIGTASPGYKLDVAGSCHASSFPTSSDARLKTNVRQITNALEKLEKIRGVSFEWNKLYESFGRSTGHREIGVIAQEVEAEFPELVTTWGDESYRAVDYGRLTGVLIEAVKELKAENEALSQRIQTLERIIK